MMSAAAAIRHKIVIERGLVPSEEDWRPRESGFGFAGIFVGRVSNDSTGRTKSSKPTILWSIRYLGN